MKTKYSSRITSCALGLSALGVAAFAAPAQARTSSAWGAGSTVDSSQAGCFAVSSGAVQNFCSGQSPRWEAALPIDGSGGKTVTISTQGIFSFCYAFAVDRSGLNASSGTMVSPPPAGPNNTALRKFININLNSSGVLVAGCDVPGGSVLRAFEWNP